MQSAAPRVLRDPGPPAHRRAGRPQAAAEAREAGFEHVNLDLIYGTPGETADDFAASLAAAIDAGVDHVSAYALIVEDGTRLAARMRRGELPLPVRRRGRRPLPGRRGGADRGRASAGTRCRTGPPTAAGRCRHNLLYWTGGDWWGLGPGAHSHVGGVRWWNVKHPPAYAAAAGRRRARPAHGREMLDRRPTGTPRT